MSLELLFSFEVAGVFLLMASFFAYQWFQLGKRIESNKEEWRQILKNKNKHIKKLRTEIQDLKKQFDKALEKEKNKLAEIEKSTAEIVEKNSELKTINKSHYEELTELRSKNKKLIREKQDLEKQLETQQAEQEDYETLYHDLKNSIAFSMSGGEDVLDLLRNRLWENGNIDESRKLEELKQRYNSIGESLGVKQQSELFGIDEEQINAEISTEQEADKQQIEQLENLAGDVEQLLNDETSFNNVIVDSANENEQVLNKDLNNAKLRIDALENKLGITHKQLMLFVEKARHFQKQKERIAMYKSSQAQMNQNMMNLSTEHKSLQRKYDALDAKYSKLQQEISASGVSTEISEKIDHLTSRLTEKEREMECLKMERLLLEQQFIEVANESEILKDSAVDLERLQNEHQLLEQQFLEVIEELENTPSGN